MDRGFPHLASIAALHLDLANECLWWGEQEIRLTPKAFSLLRCLVEHRNRLVTKEALLEAVWPSACVEEGQVKQFVAELRRILHDDPRAPRFVETVHGRGYRFIGDIRVKPAELTMVSRAASAPAAGSRVESRSRGPQPARACGCPGIAVFPLRAPPDAVAGGRLADAVTEDAIAGLTRSRSLSVAARRATARCAEQGFDPRRLAAELGVSYLLEGSVRSVEGGWRIGVSLVDCLDERTLWAERYDAPAAEAAADRIAGCIVGAVEPQVLEAEAARLRGQPAERYAAGDWVLSAIPRLHTLDEHDLHEAGSALDRAIGMAPEQARAHAYKAWWHNLRIGEARAAEPARETMLAIAAAQRAMALAPADPFVLAVAAHVEALLERRPESAAELFDRSLRLNDHSPFTWGLSGVTCCYLGRADEARARLEQAERLNPFDPLSFVSCSGRGLAEFLGGRYDAAVAWLERALRQNPRFVATHRSLASALWHAGRNDEARVAATRLLALDRGFSVSHFAARYPLRRQDDLARYLAGLRGAGLPN